MDTPLNKGLKEDFTTARNDLERDIQRLLNERIYEDHAGHKLTFAEFLIFKNRAYGNSFTTAPRMLEFLFPDGIRVDQYGDLMYIVRVLDKLKRIAEANDPFGENPASDIKGYSVLQEAVANLKRAHLEDQRQQADLERQLEESVAKHNGDRDRAVKLGLTKE